MLQGVMEMQGAINSQLRLMKAHLCRAWASWWLVVNYMGQVQWHFPAIGYVCLTMISTQFIHPFNYIAVFILAKCRNFYEVSNSEINRVLPVLSHKLIKNFHCVRVQWKYQGLLTILVSNGSFPKESSQPVPRSSSFHPYLCISTKWAVCDCL